jgi:nicotinate-nucleotide pyrophosphorylase (carboxylating)
MSEDEFENAVTHIIERALLEDIGMGDVTTEATVSPDIVGEGNVLVKEPGIIAGLGVARLVFRIVDPELGFHQPVEDGTAVTAGMVAAKLHGPLASVLKGERTALNVLQRMSGIATLTRRYVDAVRGTRAKIIDTRKTAPGLRILDKKAVRLGGGENHRFGLDDMMLIKDNHIAASGGIAAALDACRKYLSTKRFSSKVEIETKSIAEVREALEHGGMQRIMLDNFSVGEMRDAVALIGRKVEVEASGNVSLDNVRSIAETGVDFISVGALTHSPRALDISLKISVPGI